MPKKFSLFKSACIISLICLTAMVLIVFYWIFIEYGRAIQVEIIPTIIVLGGLAIYFASAIRGLDLIKRYNSSTGVSVASVKTLTVLFLFQSVLQILVFINLIDEVGKIHYRFRMAIYFREYLSFISNSILPIIVFLATLYWQIFVFNLVSAVEARHEKVLHSLDEIGNPPKQ